MEKIFADGMIFKRPREGAPEFVRGSVAVKVGEFVAFLNKHVKPDGWVNLTLKESKNGKLYFELDTWTKGSTLTDEEKARIQALRAGENAKKAVVDETLSVDAIPF